MKHLVNSLKFDMHCPQEGLAFDLRAEVTDKLQAVITDGIGRICSAHVAGDQQLLISKLEIDLGYMRQDEFGMDLTPRFLEQFEEKLLTYLSHARSEGEPEPVQDPELRLFVHFMLTGRLPWWAEQDTLQFERLCSELVQHRPVQVLAFFQQHFREQYVWARVVKQLDDNLRQFLLDHIPVFKQAGQALGYIAGIMNQSLLSAGDPAAPAISGEIQKLLQDDRIFLLRQAPEIFEGAVAHKLHEVMAALALRTLFPSEQPERKALQETLAAVIARDLQTVQPDAGNKDGIEVTALSGSQQEAEVSGKMIVHDAGIVLLGPYLKPLFTALGFWQDGQWRDEEARERAACLLKFMATGKNADKEYNMMLEKLLCGIPLHQPIYTGFEFTGAEIKETETLLESVIRHWTALKNTSVEGFRASFLQREAVLFPREEDWQLVVERKTLDVLLESIPWGYGTLSLNWNTYLIFTEW